MNQTFNLLNVLKPSTTRCLITPIQSVTKHRIISLARPGLFQWTRRPFTTLNRPSSISNNFTARLNFSRPTFTNSPLSKFPNKAKFSTNSNTYQQAQTSHPVVGYWFLFSSSLVFLIVIVGGITRLTESGLSITEWNVIRGIQWPSSDQDWEDEFGKYQQSPEYKLLNHNINLSEFKTIFYWEWLHRNLGRTIGLVFLLPTIYFTLSKPRTSTLVTKKWMTPKVTRAAWLCCCLVGFQGALGWYMVKSGLNDDILALNNATPRVSQYRLAAHLGSAFVIYSLSLWNGFSIVFPISVKNIPDLNKVLANPKFKSMLRSAHCMTALVFITALSGAFVAGMDAGLIYNTWPQMGDTFFPPLEELFRRIDSTSINGNAQMLPIGEKLDFVNDFFQYKLWKNVFENPVLAQLDHRLLAYTTFISVVHVWLTSRHLKKKTLLPRSIPLAANVVMGIAVAQLGLGISTVLYCVPIQLAAVHQAGSLTLLTSAIWLMHRVKQVKLLKRVVV